MDLDAVHHRQRFIVRVNRFRDFAALNAFDFLPKVPDFHATLALAEGTTMCEHYHQGARLSAVLVGC